MDALLILLGLLIWPVTLLELEWIVLTDWVGLLAWWSGIIAPKKKVEEFEQHKERKRNPTYKNIMKKHKRKWKIRLLIPIPVYAGVYLLFAFLLPNPMLAFFIAFWPSLIVFDRLATKEAKEQKAIIDLYTCKSGKTGDGSESGKTGDGSVS